MFIVKGIPNALLNRVKEWDVIIAIIKANAGAAGWFKWILIGGAVLLLIAVLAAAAYLLWQWLPIPELL